MDIALFLPDKFNYETLLFDKLNEHQVKTIHVATSLSNEYAVKYAEQTSGVAVVFNNSGRKLQRLYEANAQVENVIFFYNGNSPTPENEKDGYRTSRALVNAMNKNKNILIYPYKTKALSVQKKGDLVEIKFFNRLEDINRIKAIYLDKEQLKSMIETLQAFV